MTEALQQIAVAGAGRMGRGIALAFALAGYPVALVDSEERDADEFAQLAKQVAGELDEEAQQLCAVGLVPAKEKAACLQRITLLARAEAGPALREADVVFEAVVEALDIKRVTYAWLSDVAGDDTVLASTTSTMLSDTLAGFVKGPARFTNAHWLNPAYLMPLVEISPGQQTDATVVARLRALLEAIGKVPVVCAASPGYILSRLQALVLNEAARLVEEGVASAADIDRAIRAGFGPRYSVFGPLEFIDWGGGDILYYASTYLADAMADPRFAPPQIVRDNMAAGRNGMREGQGFYDWQGIDLDDYRREHMAAFTRLLGSLDLLPPAIARASTDTRSSVS